MKYLLAAFLIMTVSLCAQEYWGNANYIWGDGGGTLYMPEPYIHPIDNEVLITFEFGSEPIYRIMWLDMNLFLPESLSVAGYSDISPFISYDGITLYFSSDRPGGYGGFDIWKSVKIGEEWQMPVNLGTEINSAEDETGPALPLDQGEIYFHRGIYDVLGYVSGHLYSSENINGQWNSAQLIPGPINSSYDEYKPSVRSDGSKLYFISTRPNGINMATAVWVSYREQNNWLEPTLLQGEINQVLYSGWDCVHYNTVSATIDISGQAIIFNKLGMCDGCPDGRVYQSDMVTDISDEIEAGPQNYRLHIYPNPFNSSVNISALGSSGTIAIYDILGREIRDLGMIDPGGPVTWDGANRSGEACPSGIYFVRFQSADRAATRHITLLR